MSFKKHFFSVFAIVFIFNYNSYGQNSNQDKYYVNDTTHWQMEVPIWIPGFRGQLAYGELGLDPVPDPFEEGNDPKRINKKTAIEFYISGKISARFNNFLFELDGVSGTIGSTVTFVPIHLPNEKELVHLRIQGTIPRLFAGYSIWNTTKNDNFKIELIPYIGVRYINIHLESDILNNGNIIDVHPDWFEPIVGLYIPFSYKRMKLEILTDWGKNNSKNSFVINSNIRYRISRLIDVKLGWMSLNLNHDDLFINEKFDIDLSLYGPSAGISFIF